MDHTHHSKTTTELGKSSFFTKDGKSADSFEGEFQGLELALYAREHGMKEREVWDLIKSGKLTARTQNGKLYVYEKDLETGSPREGNFIVNTAQTNDSARGMSSELALFFDHLSLAKEENKEILRLTQSSIKQITEMSQSIIASKDEIIRNKEDKLATLNDKLAEQTRMVNQLRQEIEDLKILNRTLDRQD
jgi:hypothetical protein